MDHPPQLENTQADEHPSRINKADCKRVPAWSASATLAALGAFNPSVDELIQQACERSEAAGADLPRSSGAQAGARRKP